MPRLKSETFGAGDMTWLASEHSITECKTGTIDISGFTAGTHYPNGYIPSGTPLALASGLYVPYTSAEGTATGPGVLAGHLLTDQPVVGTNDFAAPILDHGRVRTAKVPQGTDAFTAPVAAAKRINVTIVYV
jgi:hypothetical protein